MLLEMHCFMSINNKESLCDIKLEQFFVILKDIRSFFII